MEFINVKQETYNVRDLSKHLAASLQRFRSVLKQSGLNVNLETLDNEQLKTVLINRYTSNRATVNVKQYAKKHLVHLFNIDLSKLTVKHSVIPTQKVLLSNTPVQAVTNVVKNSTTEPINIKPKPLSPAPTKEVPPMVRTSKKEPTVPTTESVKEPTKVDKIKHLSNYIATTLSLLVVLSWQSHHLAVVLNAGELNDQGYLTLIVAFAVEVSALMLTLNNGKKIIMYLFSLVQFLTNMCYYALNAPTDKLTLSVFKSNLTLGDFITSFVLVLALITFSHLYTIQNKLNNG